MLISITIKRNKQSIIETAQPEKKGLNYLTADLNSPLANIKMDIRNINFPSKYFDAIICNHVLEHIEDDRKAMSELYRVLKPNGWAILQVPYSPMKTLSKIWRSTCSLWSGLSKPAKKKGFVRILYSQGPSLRRG